MQIVSSGDNLYEMSNLILWENKTNINLSSAEFAQRAVKVKLQPYVGCQILALRALDFTSFHGMLIKDTAILDLCYIKWTDFIEKSM